MKKFLIILFIFCSVASAQDPYRILNSFNAGTISPLLIAREDLSKFQSGCSVMENMLPLPQGGAQKRPGTRYVATAKDATAVRLLPFQFSTSQSFPIEAGDRYLRFFKDHEPILDLNGTEDISALNNIVAHWLLNKEEGVNVPDDEGTHNMTASVDTSILTEPGKVGSGCFDLDGQYNVSLADHGDFSFTDNADDSAFSVACWGFVTENPGSQIFLSKWRDQASTREWRLLISREKKFKLDLVDTSKALTGDAVSQWKLNEDAANTSVVDAIALQDGVSTTNTSVLAATGVVSGAFDLGGQYAVEINDNAAYSFGDGTNDSPFSISVWAFVTDSDSPRTLLSKLDSGVPYSAEYRVYIDKTEKANFHIYDSSEEAHARRTTINDLADGWNHIVCTYGGDESLASLDMAIYINGELVSSSESSSGNYVAMEDSAIKVAIGAQYDSTHALSSFYPDKLDNVIIFDKELSSEEIESLYNSGAGIEDLSTTGADASASSDDTIDAGWHFFTSTYSAPADETTAADGIILYVDGVAVDSTNKTDADYTAMQNGAEEIRMGAQRNAGDTANERYWSDKIDEVSVYSDVLTPTEVASLFTSTIYQVSTPYRTADLFELKFEQSADVLYLFHPDYETRTLSRIEDSLWDLSVFGAESGPFRTQNSTVTSTLAASGTTGSVTLTATGSTPFEFGSTEGHEPSGSSATSKSQTGALFELIHANDSIDFVGSLANAAEYVDCGTIYKGGGWTMETNGTWRGTIEVQRNYTVGAATAAAGWEAVYSFTSGTSDGNGTEKNTLTTKRTEDENDASYQMVYTTDWGGTLDAHLWTDQTEVVGVVKITSVTSPTVAIGEVVKTLGSTDDTYRWSEGAWSNYRGWPQTGAFFEDRLMFGGNPSQPDTIWGSVTGGYDKSNMLAGPDDSDAVIFTLTSRQVNAIQWIIGKDKLLIGTSGAEWTIDGGSDEPLTPSNVKAKQHSSYGSSNLQALIANDTTLFFQRNSKRMRELAFSWELDSYVAPDMTILAKEITADGIVDAAFQQIPDTILWCVRSDGDIATFSYERKENVTAWSHQITEGDFESVTVISGDTEDEVWVSVNREIDGDTTVRHIEYFSTRDFGTDLDDAYFVDDGITYDGVVTSTITGLDHLEGQKVEVLADGVVKATQIVSGGSITIAAANTVQTGLKYTVRMQTMPLSWLGQGGTIHGRMKRISEVISSWYMSGDFSVGRSDVNYQTYEIDGMTTNEERLTFPPGWDRYGYAYVYQDSPEPLTILALMLEFEVQ